MPGSVSSVFPQSSDYLSDLIVTVFTPAAPDPPISAPPLRREVSTESSSDRVSIDATVDVVQDGNPVATALGTELITLRERGEKPD